MGITIPMNKRSVAVEEIFVTVTCPLCKHGYDVQMKGSSRNKTCRCTKITFVFEVSAMPNKIKVNTFTIGNDMAKVPLIADNAYIEREDE